MEVAGDAKTPDPWLKNDPWVKPKQACKWEDLKLVDHHFTDKDGAKLEQIHRLQLTSAAGGLCFCTKRDLQHAIDISPQKPTGLLLPNSANIGPKLIGSKFRMSPPIEVVVADSNAQSICKRQVIKSYSW